MKHALLSPSSAHRWINCTPSAVRESRYPDSESEFAVEGSLAHAIAARQLCLIAGLPTFDADCEIEKYRRGHDVDAISRDVQHYVDIVHTEYRRARQRDPHAVLCVETRLDVSDYVQESHGTADAMICEDGHLHIYDLKFGRGVKVDAPGNPQMRIYALGAIDHFGCEADIKTVTTTIIQPRLSHESSETLSVEDLEAWATVILRPAAAAAIAGEGTAQAGTWCKFCKHRTCRTLAAFVLSNVAADDAEGDGMTAEALGRDILPKLQTVKDWVSRIESAALDMARDGQKIPGYTLSRAPGRRTVVDEPAVIKAMETAGFDIDTVAPRKLTTLTALEKLAGKKRLAEICDGYIVKKEGAQRLSHSGDADAPASDFEAFSLLGLLK